MQSLLPLKMTFLGCALPSHVFLIPREQDARWIPSKHSGFPQALPFLHLCLHVDPLALSRGAQPLLYS